MFILDFEFNLVHFVAILIGFILGMLIGSCCSHSSRHQTQRHQSPDIQSSINFEPYRRFPVNQSSVNSGANRRFPGNQSRHGDNIHYHRNTVVNRRVVDIFDVLDHEPRRSTQNAITLPHQQLKEDKIDSQVECSLNRPCKCCLDIKVFFSPACDLKFGFRRNCNRTECTKNHDQSPAQYIGNTIKQTYKTIDVCMFRFSKQLNIIDDLIKARKRGVIVRVFADISKGRSMENAQDDYSNHLISLSNLHENGFQIRGLEKDGMMHNKFAIFDKHILINGSMNWTYGGIHKNYEASTLTKNPILVSIFQAEFEQLWTRSQDWLNIGD